LESELSKHLLTIIDYGMGNLHSVAKAIEHVAPNYQVEITADTARIAAADHVVLPGVGAIRDCMAEIRAQGVDALVSEVLASGRPFLGICVGMQALMRASDENGGVTGLNTFPGQVHRFPKNTLDDHSLPMKVPHMGWNNVYQQGEHPLWQGIESGERFYFVHSYYVEPQPAYTIGTCSYGPEFAAMVYRDNLFATQIHPEKSHTAGLQL
jgi:glutamine amidotransferase